VSLSGIIVYIVASFVPSLTAFAVLFAIARTHGSRLWFAPGLLAAAGLAPAISLFFAVRLLIATFQAMAMSGGGIAAVSAGMWEATELLIAASSLAIILAIVTSIVAIRSVIHLDEQKSQTSSARTVMSLAVLLLALGAIVIPSMLFRKVTSHIFEVTTPHTSESQTLGVGEVSRLISSRLTLTAGIAIGVTFVLLAAIAATAATKPAHPPQAHVARFIALAAIIAVLGATATTFGLRTLAARLYQTAMTGKFAP